MANERKRGLGRGLSALISPATTDDLKRTPPRPPLSANSPQRQQGAAPHQEPRTTQQPPAAAVSNGSVLVELDPHIIRQNPKQPRHEFREEALAELADSIRKDGVLEPVIVRIRNGQYELVSGERRVKATILADRETIPAIVRDVSDRDMLKLGLIENIQREDLNPMETALAYQGLIQEFNWTQEQLAEEVGKKRATVTNTLRLLQLPPDVQKAVAEGAISTGHAKALLSLESTEKQMAACRKIIAEGLSVRQAEKFSAPSPPKPVAVQPTQAQDPHVAQIEEELRRKFGTKVRVQTNDAYRGKIELEFYNLDDLDRLLNQLRR